MTPNPDTAPKAGVEVTPSGLDLKVTRIAQRWIAVLSRDGQEHSRMACALKRDIGWICRELLRWFSKLGGDDPWADAARQRQTAFPIGKVWCAADLENERLKIALRKIAERKPCTYAAASAFYVSRRNAREALYGSKRPRIAKEGKGGAK